MLGTTQTLRCSGGSAAADRGLGGVPRKYFICWGGVGLPVVILTGDPPLTVAPNPGYTAATTEYVDEGLHDAPLAGHSLAGRRSQKRSR